VHPDDLAGARQFLVDVQSGAALPDVLTYRLRHKSGEYRYFETRWVARRDASGQVTQLQTAARDVTDRKRVDEQLNALTEELRSLSLRDELTGLYNRRGFLEIAGQTRDVAARDGRAAALIFIDLNGMKGINDQFGHDAGDAALLDATRVLLSAHGEGDVVARLGGDEFAVFCIDFRPWDLEPLRLRFRELADAEVAQRGRVYRISLSAGAAYLEPGSQESLRELLRRADAAMYEQKSSRVIADGVTLVPPSGTESRTGSGDARFR
jgi:diguanylate cyclase (GGDEF)-like protein